jgi:WD40 repeat protein
MKTYSIETILEGHTLSVNSVSFSPDGSKLASGSRDNTIKIWDMKTHFVEATLEGHANSVSSVSFSPDGSTIASGSGDRTLKIWDFKIL